MAVMYNVFDKDTGKLLAVCDTEERAVAIAAELLAANSDAYAQELVVDGETAVGEIIISLTGEQLLTRVRLLQREHAIAGHNKGSDGSGYGDPFGAMAAKGFRG